MGILFLMEKTASDRPLLHISSISLVSPELGLGYYFHALFHHFFTHICLCSVECNGILRKAEMKRLYIQLHVAPLYYFVCCFCILWLSARETLGFHHHKMTFHAELCVRGSVCLTTWALEHT